MAHISIRSDGGILRYAHRLAAAADRIPQAEREGLKEGGDLVRTRTRQTLRAQMNTKGQGPITAGTSGGLAGDRTYIIRGSGKGLPIEKFPVRGGRRRAGNWRDQPRDGKGRFGHLKNNDAGKVTAEPWGASHRFKRSYVTTGGSYVARLPGTRRVRRLYGPSIAKEIVKDQTAAMFEGTAAQTVQGMVIKRLARLL